MRWIEYRLRKPEEGKKVACFKNGDIWIGSLVGDIMHCPTSVQKTGVVPEMWYDFESFPDGYEGKMRISPNKNVVPLTLPKAKKEFPETYQQFVKDMSNHEVLENLEEFEVKDIIRCEASGNYTIFFLNSRSKIIVGKTLKEYEEMLEEHNFFRTHKSHLINLDFMRKYVKGTGGHVIMSDGTEIEVAKRRKESFLDRLQKAV